MGSQGFNISSGGKQRSKFMDGQTDLNLRCKHVPTCTLSLYIMLETGSFYPSSLIDSYIKDGWAILYLMGSTEFSKLHRGSYTSAHILLNLLNKLGKRDKMRVLPSIISLFCDKFDKLNKT